VGKVTHDLIIQALHFVVEALSVRATERAEFSDCMGNVASLLVAHCPKNRSHFRVCDFSNRMVEGDCEAFEHQLLNDKAGGKISLRHLTYEDAADIPPTLRLKVDDGQMAG
jgi:hypothetical protein